MRHWYARRLRRGELLAALAWGAALAWLAQ